MKTVPLLRHLLALGAAALVLSGCGKHDAGSAPTAELPLARVRLASVRAQTLPARIETTGTVRPVHRAVLAAKVMGAIEELPITLGQSVKAGEVLATIAAGEISARLRQAQSQLNVVRRDLDRERELLGKGASTTDTVKGLEDRLALNEALVREAEILLGYATLRAPFDGVVARKLVNAGDLAAPGQPLLEIEGLRAFEIEADIPDSLASALAVGTAVQIDIPASGASFEAAIAELSSAADPVARSVMAKIAVPPAAAVRSGQFARVLLPGPPAHVLLAPATAVSLFGQLERVFVAAHGRAELRLVKTGAHRGEDVEIASGLEAGEQIVVDPSAALRDGQRLEIAP